MRTQAKGEEGGMEGGGLLIVKEASPEERERDGEKGLRGACPPEKWERGQDAEIRGRGGGCFALQKSRKGVRAWK